ncbi:hypothetical protein BJV82DRAFT_92975 [Fennellomyces sp. T-0311]|nr:hypothetical protein BJV82DRAFT_92975 [Fennellomyces sp. T-0311]
MELYLFSLIPNSLTFLATLSAFYQLRPSPPYYYLYRLPILAKLIHFLSFLLPLSYGTVASVLAILLAWFSVAVYWINLNNRTQVIQQCKKKVIYLIIGSFWLACFFGSDSSPKPWDEQMAAILSALFAFMFLAITFLPRSHPPLFLIFGAIIAAQPMQMTIHLGIVLADDCTEIKPLLRFFWFLAAGFEGLLPLYAVTYFANEEIVWPEFKAPPLIDNHRQSAPPPYVVVVSSDDERRTLLG